MTFASATFILVLVVIAAGYFPRVAQLESSQPTAEEVPTRES